MQAERISMANKIAFHDAAMRHYADAKLLETDHRHANAGHLYGFVAECGIKALLVAGGLAVDAEGDIQRYQGQNFRRHIDQLAIQINAVDSFLQGRAMAGYLAHIPDIADFRDWNTAHRYYDESQIPHSLDKWRYAASQVMTMLDAVRLDGKI